jgi:hypothetical protein
MPTVRASTVAALPTSGDIQNQKVAARFLGAIERYRAARAEIERLEAELVGLAGTADEPGVIWRTVEQYGAHEKAELPRDSQIVAAGSKWHVVGARSVKFDNRAVELIELAGQLAGPRLSASAKVALDDRFRALLQDVVGPDVTLTDRRVQAALQACQDMAAGQAIKTKKDVDAAVWDAFVRNGRLPAVLAGLRQDREQYGLREWTVVED